MKPTWNYGLSIITWNFWSWKTFWLWIELYKLKDENPNVCIISNVPRSITDINYNSIDDFQNVLDHLYKFFEETNNELEDYDKKRKDIVLVMDESQIYFPARWFGDKKQKQLREKLTIILTQCRKRYTKIRCATQRTKMLDMNFRRLADYIRFFYKDSILGFKFAKLHIFECSWAINDLLWDEWTLFNNPDELAEMDINDGAIARHQTEILNDLLVILHPKRKLRIEKPITKHISWLLEDVYKLEYEDFKKKLYLNEEKKEEHIICIRNQDYLPLILYKTKI